MRLLHITEADNFVSIMKTGLKPCVPKLVHHRKALEQGRLPSKVIYAWDAEDPRKMAKVAKDVAYWHVWGWRINDLLRHSEEDVCMNRHLQIEGPPIRDQVFVALTFDATEGVHRYWENEFYKKSRVTHSAHPKGLTGACWKDMDPRYAHSKMPMTWVSELVPPEKIRPWAMLWTKSKRRRWKWDVDVHIRRFK